MKIKKQSILDFFLFADDRSLSELMNYIKVLSEVIESDELDSLNRNVENLITSIEKFVCSIRDNKCEVASFDLKSECYFEIISNPGISVKEICVHLNESYSRVKYCVNQLFDDNFISADKSGYIHHFFPNI